MNTAKYVLIVAIAWIALLASSARADVITNQLTMPNIGSNVPISNYSFTSSTFTFSVPDGSSADANLFTMLEAILQGKCSGISCDVPSSDVFTFDNSQLSFTDTFTDSIITSLVTLNSGGTAPPEQVATFNYASMTETPAATPEPSSLLLLGTGLLGLAGMTWHRVHSSLKGKLPMTTGRVQLLIVRK